MKQPMPRVQTREPAEVVLNNRPNKIAKGMTRTLYRTSYLSVTLRRRGYPRPNLSEDAQRLSVCGTLDPLRSATGNRYWMWTEKVACPHCGAKNQGLALNTRGKLRLDALRYMRSTFNVGQNKGNFYAYLASDLRLRYSLLLEHKGRMILLEEQEDGHLKITLTEAGRTELMDYYLTTQMGFSKSGGAMWSDLLEDISCNSLIRILSPEEVGALTEAPIIGGEVNYADNGKLESTGTVWWFPNYMVEDELETLLTKGEVIFTRAEES